MSRARLIAAVIGALALLPAPALAGTASLAATLREGEDQSDNTSWVLRARYDAAAGERNVVAATADAGGVSVRETGGALTAGPGCSPSAPGEVRCPWPESPSPFYDVSRSLEVVAADGDDTVTVAVSGIGLDSFLQVQGGPGNDLLTGSAAADSIDGGPDDDRLDGGDGADWLYGASGADVVDGGAGVDTAQWSVDGALRLDLSRGRADAGPGEVDVVSAVENVGADATSGSRLAGDAGANRLSSGAAADVVIGRGGADVLVNRDFSKLDQFFGGAGDDELDGSAARRSCGPGNDVVDPSRPSQPGRLARRLVAMDRDCERLRVPEWGDIEPASLHVSRGRLHLRATPHRGTYRLELIVVARAGHAVLARGPLRPSSRPSIPLTATGRRRFRAGAAVAVELRLAAETAGVVRVLSRVAAP